MFPASVQIRKSLYIFSIFTGVSDRITKIFTYRRGKTCTRNMFFHFHYSVDSTLVSRRDFFSDFVSHVDIHRKFDKRQKWIKTISRLIIFLFFFFTSIELQGHSRFFLWGTLQTDTILCGSFDGARRNSCDVIREIEGGNMMELDRRYLDCYV